MLLECNDVLLFTTGFCLNMLLIISVVTLSIIGAIVVHVSHLPTFYRKQRSFI